MHSVEHIRVVVVVASRDLHVLSTVSRRATGIVLPEWVTLSKRVVRQVDGGTRQQSPPCIQTTVLTCCTKTATYSSLYHVTDYVAKARVWL